LLSIPCEQIFVTSDVAVRRIAGFSDDSRFSFFLCEPVAWDKLKIHTPREQTGIIHYAISGWNRPDHGARVWCNSVSIYSYLSIYLSTRRRARMPYKCDRFESATSRVNFTRITNDSPLDALPPFPLLLPHNAVSVDLETRRMTNKAYRE
jgi:hypothetical protein